MMNWQIGDRAVLIKSIHGHLGHVVDVLGDHTLARDNEVWPSGTSGYSIMCCGAKYFCVSSWLGPIPDDGLSSWDELEKIIDWNPRITV